VHRLSCLRAQFVTPLKMWLPIPLFAVSSGIDNVLAATLEGKRSSKKETKNGRTREEIAEDDLVQLSGEAKSNKALKTLLRTKKIDGKFVVCYP
jgi:hypothetical protein